MTAFETASFFSFVFIFTSLLLSYKNPKKDNKKLNIPNIIAIIILTIIPGIQFSQNVSDIWHYQNIFYENSLITWKEFFEKTDTKIAFYSIAKFLYPFGGRILVFSFFSFIMVYTSYSYVIDCSKKNSIYVAELCFLTGIYCTGAFNVLKQGIAVCIVLYGMRFIFNNDLKKYIITVIVALLFHPSSLIAILLYFIWDHKNNASFSKNKNALIIILSTIIIVFYQQVITFISSTFSLYDDYSGYANINTIGKNRDFYLDLLVLAFFIIISNRMKRYDDKSQYMLCLYIISVIIGFTGFYNPYLKRIAFFFSVPSEMYLFSLIPNLFTEKKSISLVKFILTIYFILLWIFVRYIISENGWIYNFDLTNKTISKLIGV